MSLDAEMVRAELDELREALEVARKECLRARAREQVAVALARDLIEKAKADPPPSLDAEAHRRVFNLLSTIAGCAKSALTEVKPKEAT